MSPLTRQTYAFTKMIYQYLTRQQTGKDFRESIYLEYTKLMDICYSVNKAEMSDEWVSTVFNLIDFVIDREYSGPVTFILLNDNNHYLELKRAMEFLRYYNTAPYYNYADFDEFYIVMDHFRKQFDNYPIDTPSAVGKFMRKDRVRFNREPNKKKKKKEKQ